MSKLLAAILATYLLLALAYVALIPAWEAPDEPAHFLYVQALLETGDPPAPPPPQRDSFRKSGYVTSNYEWHQPPLFYWLAATGLRLGQALGLPTAFTGFPSINPAFPGAVRLFAGDAIPPVTLYLVRGLSALFGLLTVYSAYWLARRLALGVALLPELAAGLVAFVPQFTFLSAYVTNDSLAILAGSAGLAALVTVVTASPAHQRRAWLVAGSFTSVGLTTKMTAWYLAPLGLVLLGVEWLTGRRTLRASVADLAAFLGSAAVLPLLIWLRWPDIAVRLGASPQTRGINRAALSLTYLVELFPLTRSSFWGRFGWMNAPIPEWVVVTFEAIWLTGLGAFVVFWLRRRIVLAAARRHALFVVLAAFLLGFGLFLGFNLAVRQPQGRFLYTGLAGVAAIVAWGWVVLAARWRSVVVAVLLTAMALLNAASLGLVRTGVYG